MSKMFYKTLQTRGHPTVYRYSCQLSTPRGQLESETGVSTGYVENGGLSVTRSLDRMKEFAMMKGLGDILGLDLELVGLESDRNALRPKPYGYQNSSFGGYRKTERGM